MILRELFCLVLKIRDKITNVNKGFILALLFGMKWGLFV